jgi:predicted amidohydrolase YtcJ
VGDSAAIQALAGPSTRRLDLGGRTVVPGFNDAHQHIEITPPATDLVLPDEPTLAQLESAIKTALASAPAGQLLRGIIGQTAWGDPVLSRDWLDAIARTTPVWLTGFTGHGVMLNSAALALVDITDSVKEIEGGRFGRDAQGRLNGRLEETAGEWAERLLATKASPAAAAARYRAVAAEALGYGITTIQLMADPLPIAETGTRLVEANSPIRWKAYRFPMRAAGGETIDSRPTLPPQPTARIDLRGMKWIIDGTPIERLAYMKEPYADARAERGRLNLPQSRIDEFVGWAYGSEDPLLVHAIGDAALDAYLTALEKTGRPEVWRAKRPRIEHGDMLSGDLLTRVKALGVVVAVNPFHFMFPDVYLARLGPARQAWMMPVKAMLERGIPVAIGSDGPMNPFMNVLWAATHAANPSQALTREQAVTAYTRGSAFAEFTERDKGQLAVGMLADLAVLSADLFTATPGQIPAITSVLTMVGGKPVHDAGVIRP